MTVFIIFFILPIFEQFIPKYESNYSDNEKKEILNERFYDLLLYFNVPISYLVVFLYVNSLLFDSLQLSELIGITLSVGTVIGACCINVAHELGHRKNKFENFLAKALLLPAFYMHFFIEHNRGHHKNVATPNDPASSRKGENLYQFWFRSIKGSYLSAWKIQLTLLEKNQQKFFSLNNEMLIFHIIKFFYLAFFYYFFGVYIASAVFIVGFLGILLLETINYIEHYGLNRELLPSGKYETVKPYHSWNSDFSLGRIMLYELTRHSDHHYLASKKYQTLDSYKGSPQLPFGYPASMVISFFPPLWFYIMDKRLTFDYKKEYNSNKI
ncbi:MAG: alkane 1-monooxygenase [Candidatus Sericytochromatia bacterium]